MERTDCSSSSSHGSSGEVASIGDTSTVTFHGWKYKHYFVLLSENDKNLKVRCTLCSGNKILSCARNKEVEQPEKGSEGEILMTMTVIVIQRGSALYQQC